MLLSPEDAKLFFNLYRSYMCFVNERLQVVPDINTLDQYSALRPETRITLRNASINKTGLIESFVEQNPFSLNEEELEIVSSWRHQVTGKFFILRYLKKYAVFLGSEGPPIAYGVVALTDPLEKLIPRPLPIYTETTLLPFKDQIICDGLLNSYNILIGGGMKRGLNESYRKAKERLGIVTQLPVDSQPLPAKKLSRKTKTQAKRSSRNDARKTLNMIVGMIDQFCRDHLNEEYAVLCRTLAEKLARKRPSPLLSGKPSTWASGIVRTIGMVNFLQDSSRQPHMRMTDIDDYFGVASSTGSAKSKAIRNMFKIQQFHPEWTLPSRMDDNPLVWMLEVNGFLMDIRHCPREAQEIAFKKGLIPYIPADRE